MKKAEIANGLFPYFSDYQESIAKEKSYTQKAAALTELWTEKRKSFTSTQLELQKAEERKQAQKPVLEQRRNNLLEAVKLAEERDIQKNRFHTQKKNREEITKSRWMHKKK